MYCAATGILESIDSTRAEIFYSVKRTVKQSEADAATFREVIQRYEVNINSDLANLVERQHRSENMQFRSAGVAGRANICALFIAVECDEVVASFGYHLVSLADNGSYQILVEPQSKYQTVRDLPHIFGVSPAEVWSRYYEDQPSWKGDEPVQRVVRLAQAAIETYPEVVGWPICLVEITPVGDTWRTIGRTDKGMISMKGAEQ